ncbi:alpha/beta-hydrolase [Rhodocollybia butyracea]|uniref:Alpha/beta-hydrolase n=1 Tax=Rhodocollybia butyracea TaxID=206335 RepID=A0A9P5Q893_9AGAR|nr:alpha/beta-hydrolase [Rhodocollybia butyracea]
MSFLQTPFITLTQRQRSLQLTRRRLPWNLISCARYSSTSNSETEATTPQELDFLEQIPENGNKTNGALVILHGLFGSKRNWTSLSKAFSRDLNIPVYALDLRNHGTSPHALPMTYAAMASDVLNFIKQKKLERISLLGHSMGGKLAMTVALDPSLPPSGVLQNLIIADIAPVRAKLSNEFVLYTEAMKKIESMKLRTRKEATRVLEEYEKDTNIVLFLLTNILMPNETGEDYIRFRIPLGTLSDALSELGSFPYLPGERKWEGKTLFVKGEKSKFINHHYHSAMNDFFPNMNMEPIDTGHWVHAERPGEFKTLVENFIRAG